MDDQVTAKDFIRLMDECKKIVFCDNNTWASSGPPWCGNADNEQYGWDRAVTEVLRLLEVGAVITAGAGHIHRWRLVSQTNRGGEILETKEQCRLCLEQRSR